MSPHKYTIARVLPSYAAVGEHQNMSIWQVVKLVTENSNYYENTFYVSPKPLYGEFKDEKFFYITDPEQQTNSQDIIHKSNILTNISAQHYRPKVIGLLNSMKPKLIVLESDSATAGIIAKATGIPTICVMHVKERSKGLFGIRQRKTYNRYIKYISEFIFVGSGHQKVFLAKYPWYKNPTTVIPNAYNYIKNASPDYSKKTNQILFAGRATTDKGYKDYIKSLVSILKKNLSWHAKAVLSVEKKLYQEHLNKLLQTKEIKDLINAKRLEVMINLPNGKLFELLEQSKIVVAPTHKRWMEGCPLIAIEALYAKCAFVCSKNPGFTEWFWPVAKFLKKPNAKYIANTVNELISSGDNLKLLGEQGYKYIIENFDIKDISAQYDRIFSKYIN